MLVLCALGFCLSPIDKEVPDPPSDSLAIKSTGNGSARQLPTNTGSF